MSGTRWGVDSLDFADQGAPSSCCCGSGTLAWYTKDCWYAPDSIVFWGRYFTNVDYPNNVWRNSESGALKNVGITWVLPISQPGQGRIASGTYANGFSDGQAVCQRIMSAINTDHQLHLPGSCRLDVFIDIEGGTTVSTAYWQGWATAVNQFSTTCGGVSVKPMFACAYIGSVGTGSPNCARIQGVSSGWATLWGVWSNQPQLTNGCCGSCAGCCGGCSTPGPGWAPNNCGSWAQTRAWQYGDSGVCARYCNSGTSCCPKPNVDLDSTNPAITGPFGNDETDYLIWVN